MAEGFKSNLLISQDSANGTFLQNKHDMPNFESVAAGSNKADEDASGIAVASGGMNIEKTDGLADSDDRKKHVEAENVKPSESLQENNQHAKDAVVKGEVNIEKAEISADSDNGKKHVGEAEVVEPKTLQKNFKEPAERKVLNANSSQHTGYLARVAAYIFQIASKFYQMVLNLMFKAFKTDKRKVDETLHKLEEIFEFHDARKDGVFANQYLAAIKLASKKARQVANISESTENFQMEIADIPDKTYESSSPTAYLEANASKLVVIDACKMEYAAVKTMEKCWKDLNPGYVENAECIPRSQIEKPSNSEVQHGAVITCLEKTIAFILFLVVLGCIIVASPVAYVVSKCYRREPKEAMWRGNMVIKCEIDRRLRRLEQMFDKCKISPTHLVSEEEQ